MEQRMVSREEKLRTIEAYVEAQRRALGICPEDLSYTAIPEGTCMDDREILNLVDVQLVRTHQGFGHWRYLRDLEILDAAYRYVTTGKRYS